MSAQPTLPDVLPDQDWLAQVRADAGRWWATFDPAPDLAPPLAWGETDGGWRVWHRASGVAVFGAWPTEDAAKLWLWLALSLHAWQFCPDPARIDPERRAELAAAEARLRAALGTPAAAAAAGNPLGAAS